MTQSTLGVTPDAPERIHTTEEEEDEAFFGTDIQERFWFLLLAYNEAHYALLEARGPSAVRRTEDPDVFEIKIAGEMSTSTLTAAVTVEEGNAKLEPLDIRTTFSVRFLPVLSYDLECKDAYVTRLMACWLERAFLVHEAAILERIFQDLEMPPAAG